LRVERLISRAPSRRSSRATSLLAAEGVMRSARGRRKAAQLDGPDEDLHLARAIDLRPRHDDFISQMLVLSAVYFISEECAIFLPMAAENTRSRAIVEPPPAPRNRRRHRHGSAPER
jgi:hypothetical protein